MLSSFDQVDCISWIQDYFAQANKKVAVIGISGGVDSAVVAALCKLALGSSNVIGVMMPIDSDIGRDEVKLIRQLGIRPIEINLTNTYKTISNDVSNSRGMFNIGFSGLTDDNISQEDTNIIDGNVKTRLRMTSLYSIASVCNGLVVGTTNKSEAAIGYATKFGDGGVDIEPIQDFYKTEVYELAEDLNLPTSIISKPPSAGLWKGQTDEEELGFTYETLDKYLELNEKGTPEKGTWTTEFLIKIENMIENNKHKNLNIPYFKRKNETK
jgi:NAD+ synthase